MNEEEIRKEIERQEKQIDEEREKMYKQVITHANLKMPLAISGDINYFLEIESRLLISLDWYKAQLKGIAQGRKDAIEELRKKREEYYKRDDLMSDEVDTIILNELLTKKDSEEK